MKNKFQMSREESIFCVKRNIVDYIWKDANLEGIAISYPDTDAIYNGLSVQGYRVDDIIAVNNLKRAWKFVLDNLDYPLDYNYICKINQIIGGDSLIINAGQIRSMDVRIGGTQWKRIIPNEEEIKEKIGRVMKVSNVTERAITMMLYLTHSQVFLDGNKRTWMLAANKILIAEGAGVIAVPIEKQSAFAAMLIKYYETNDMKPLQQFVYEYCIDGMDFPKNEKTM